MRRRNIGSLSDGPTYLQLNNQIYSSFVRILRRDTFRTIGYLFEEKLLHHPQRIQSNNGLLKGKALRELNLMVEKGILKTQKPGIGQYT